MGFCCIVIGKFMQKILKIRLKDSDQHKLLRTHRHKDAQAHQRTDEQGEYDNPPKFQLPGGNYDISCYSKLYILNID